MKEKVFSKGRDAAEAIRAAAVQLLHGDGVVPRPHLGVCGNLATLVGHDVGAYALVADAAATWPHALRDWVGLHVLRSFVPRTPGFDLWEGPNLEMRMHLLQHIIEYIDDEVL